MTHLLQNTNSLERKFAKFVAPLFFLLLVTPILTSQVLSPFVPITAGSINLSPTEQTQVNKVSALPHQGALQYASVEAFNTWINGGDLNLTIPGKDGISFQTRPMVVHFDSEQAYSYVG